jgi:23S rRNA (cytidine1920-2'-O)/16S rRNA (cytidine1409-2'-O)-methyltransferase
MATVMPSRIRLDAELVRRGLARSREQAAELISSGRVAVAGLTAGKPATQVGRDAPITVSEGTGPDYVSRGGHKLAGALAAFGSLTVAGGRGPGQAAASAGDHGPAVAGRLGPGLAAASAGDHGLAVAGRRCPGQAAASAGGAGLTVAGRRCLDHAAASAGGTGLEVAGRRCLDAGASTGGFTDVLLRAGAAHVVAVDVGYGQLAWALRVDPRVTVLERVNVRELRPEQVAPPPDLVVADLSFISLVTVLPALVNCAAPDADFVLMVKPQFEVGRGRVGPGGVVRDPRLRAEAVSGVAKAAAARGLGVAGLTPSPLPGPAGNVEYFLWLRGGAPPLDPGELERAIADGPQ